MSFGGLVEGWYKRKRVLPPRLQTKFEFFRGDILIFSFHTEMRVTMGQCLELFLLSCIAASCLGAINRQKRQVASLCSQGDGRFPVDGDCKSFLECLAGNAERKSCSGRLVFNPQTQQCDRAGSVNGCQDQGHPSDTLCDANPGRPGESWKVSHPSFCNAFYTCERHFIHKRCEFCGEGTYFSESNGYCVGIENDEGSTPAECSQKQLVPHSQKAILELYPDCNLFTQNPFQRLISRIDAQQASNPTIPQQGNQGIVVGQTTGISTNQNQALGFPQPVVFVNPLPVTLLSGRVFGK